jgi:hypothetical protein
MNYLQRLSQHLHTLIRSIAIFFPFNEARWCSVDKILTNRRRVRFSDLCQNSHAHNYRELVTIDTGDRTILWSFFPSTITLWNELPAEAVSASTVDAFKTSVPTALHL